MINLTFLIKLINHLIEAGGIFMQLVDHVDLQLSGMPNAQYNHRKLTR